MLYQWRHFNVFKNIAEYKIAVATNGVSSAKAMTVVPLKDVIHCQVFEALNTYGMHIGGITCGNIISLELIILYAIDARGLLGSQHTNAIVPPVRNFAISYNTLFHPMHKRHAIAFKG